MAKKWPEKVVQRSFIKEHSFPNGLYVKSSNDYSSKNYAKNCFNYEWTLSKKNLSSKLQRTIEMIKLWVH